MSSCSTCFLVLATILGPVTLVFMAAAFGTDHWLEFDVDYSQFGNTENDSRKNSVEGRFYHTRERGIFRECYPDSNNEFLDNADLQDELVDDYCFYVKYSMPEDRDNVSDEFKTRLHLNRCFLAFFIVSIFLFLLAYIFGLVLCCFRRSKWAYVAGILAFSSAFSLAAAIAFFHGAEYIERNKMDDEGFYSSWPDKLKNATDREYGWSYAIGWVAMIMAALTATFYCILGYYITSDRYEDKDVLEKHSIRDHRPMGMEPVYAVGADAYYTKHYGYPRAYLGPMAPEYYSRYPAVGYGDPGKDMWHWREVES